ncbi:MAG TPA: glycoside hydrolase domain-containing protein [Bacillales bacterium]|nr:glycoside hydrolase domain-containing protein [Bacillales bacterium]
MPARKLWGVDSAARVTTESYRCVVNEYGKPVYWGRYLQTVPGFADGLTTEEIRLIHSRGVKILPIYSNFRSAVGYRTGRVTARNAIYHASRLGIPKDTFLFANIEKGFNVNGDWIRGWVDALYTSGFRPGIYSAPDRAAFNEAYCNAVENDEKVAEQTVLWSQEPTPGTTAKNEAPPFRPAVPSCRANVWIWQYGENAPNCPIDTNLLDPRVLNHLF